MSFAEPIQQQQTFNNPYQQQSGGFNNFNLQAQMTGMTPQAQSMPLQTQVTGMPLQAQMTGMPQQQQFQTQQFTGAASNPFGQTNPPTQQQNGIFGTPSSVNPQVRTFFLYYRMARAFIFFTCFRLLVCSQHHLQQINPIQVTPN